jgi:hypothetical protein
MTLPKIPEAGDKLTCQCGKVIGELIDINGSLWLQIRKDLELKNGHGRCFKCKKIWHFDSNDIRLQRLLKRARINKIE